jgi:tRNA(Ile)-lysidine synthase
LPELHESLIDALAAALASVPARRRLVVAVSGGLDSMLLLHACVQFMPRAGALPLQVLHVHHGLSANADAWAQHVTSTCSALGVPCRVLNVQVDRTRASLEASAREVRHAALAAALQPGDALLLAHHADDQAETVLLRLLRGSGVTGLAAMRPARALADDAWLLRPWLAIPRAALEAAALDAGLAWVEDESNGNLAHDRNFLRHAVLPPLTSRWPALPQTLAATAARLDETDRLLNAYLDAELAPMLSVTAAGQSQAVEGRVPARPVLAVPPLLAAPHEKQPALLRRWLHRLGAPVFQAHWLAEILRIAAARRDAESLLCVAGWEVHRHRGHLHAFPALPEPPAGVHLTWNLQGDLPLGAGAGLLRALPPDADAGLPVPLPGPDDVAHVSFRAGGERIGLRCGAGRRTLKKALQDLGIPPWLRARLPLLYVNGQLLAVGDALLDAQVAARLAGRPCVRLQWLPPR